MCSFQGRSPLDIHIQESYYRKIRRFFSGYSRRRLNFLPRQFRIYFDIVFLFSSQNHKMNIYIQYIFIFIDDQNE